MIPITHILNLQPPNTNFKLANLQINLVSSLYPYCLLFYHIIIKSQTNLLRIKSTLIPKSGPLSVLYNLSYFNTLVVPVLPSTHLHYIIQSPSCQSIPSIINKTFTNTLPFPFPFKNKLSTRLRFLHLRTAGSINEKRFDGDPNEVRGRGEKTESLFGQRRGCGETWFPKYI